jgi:Tat protein translocase TatC
MPEAVQDAPDVNDQKANEELTKMSFGDHLDELRRRLVICTATLFVCVGVMMPFKDQVTNIYTGPYQLMWAHAYQDFLVELDEEFVEGVGPQDPHERMAAAMFLTPMVIDAIVEGRYPTPGEVAGKSGFPRECPLPSSAEWPAWKRDFKIYALEVRDQLDLLDEYNWNRERKDAIFAGKFDENRKASRIFTRGGFALKKSLIAMGGLEDFWTFMAAALLFSCIAASPVLLWHVWAFIAAGLYKTERAVIYKTIPFAILLLGAGVAFGYFIMVPYGLYFLTRLMDWAQVTPMFSVTNYFKFFLTLTVALGMVFQLPILMLALQKVGILKLQMMTKNWRWVVLSFFVISAMLTPPDPITQALMVTPMLTLFGLGLFLMWRNDRKQKRAA